jgi:hypothetical protein
MMLAMKGDKPAPNPDDIELHPDAWDCSFDAVKLVARHPAVEKPKPQAKPSKGRLAVHKRKR